MGINYPGLKKYIHDYRMNLEVLKDLCREEEKEEMSV